MSDMDFSKVPHYVTYEFTKMMKDNFSSELFKKCYKNQTYKMLLDVIELAHKDGFEWDEIQLMVGLKDTSMRGKW